MRTLNIHFILIYLSVDNYDTLNYCSGDRRVLHTISLIIGLNMSVGVFLGIVCIFELCDMNTILIQFYFHNAKSQLKFETH